MKDYSYLVRIALIASLFLLGLSFGQLLFSSNSMNYTRFFIQILGEDQPFNQLLKKEIQEIIEEIYNLNSQGEIIVLEDKALSNYSYRLFL